MSGWEKRQTKPARERREPGFDDPRGETLRADPDDRVSGGRRRKTTGDGRREPRFGDRDDLRADPRELQVSRRKSDGAGGKRGGRLSASGRRRTMAGK